MDGHLLVKVLVGPCVSQDDSHALVVHLGFLPRDCCLLQQGCGLLGIDTPDILQPSHTPGQQARTRPAGRGPWLQIDARPVLLRPCKCDIQKLRALRYPLLKYLESNGREEGLRCRPVQPSLRGNDDTMTEVDLDFRSAADPADRFVQIAEPLAQGFIHLATPGNAFRDNKEEEEDEAEKGKGASMTSSSELGYVLLAMHLIVCRSNIARPARPGTLSCASQCFN